MVDEGGKLAKAFGVPTIRDGKFDARWTIVVGRDGKILTVDSEVGKDIAGHPKRLVAALQKDWENYRSGYTPLFNGRDLTDWVTIESVLSTWSVRDGLLQCSGKPTSYLRTKRSYRNYALLVEFQYTEQLGNAGLLIHINGPDKVWPKSFEPNLNVNQMGRLYEIGGVTATHARADKQPIRKVNVEPGTWNRYEIICKGDMITLVLNGQVVNRAVNASVTSGRIGIQAEGVPLHFRTVAIKSLE